MGEAAVYHEVADAQPRRAARLRAELAAVERLVHAIEGDVVWARASGDRTRAAEPFEVWWWQNMNMLPQREAIASELAAIARSRARALRDAVDAGLEVTDTLALAFELRRAIDAADAAASHAQSDAIRAALLGHDAVAQDGNVDEALRELARARVLLELVVASLIPLCGEADPIVVRFVGVARELRAPVEVPDNGWRRRVCTARSRVAALLGELEAQH